MGAGQLGSRHLQGLAQCRLPLDILLVDPSIESLDRSRSRWQEAASEEPAHAVSFMQSLDNVVGAVDLAIVATPARGRAELVQTLGTRLQISCWVIEKVLAQSESELDLICSAVGGKARAWVNTPRRMMAWYHALKQATPHRSPSTCTVSGGDWGLACNAIHFLDVMAWWTGETVTQIDTGRLASRWHPAKRAGYHEVYGTLVVRLSAGSELVLSCAAASADLTMSLVTQDGEWSVRELEGVAVRTDGASLPGRLELQSGMTGELAASILSDGTCGLPPLEESAVLHRPLLKSLLAHWNSTMSNHSAQVPIT